MSGLLCLLAAPATVSAAVRFAAPAGGGTACSEVAPCDIQTAVEAPAVVNGDEVILLAGTYNTGTNPLVASDAIYLHGAAGAPRPLINSNSGFAVVIGQQATIENVEVRTSHVLALILDVGARGLRVHATSTANGGIGCYLAPHQASPPLLQDSACIATGSGATGVWSNATVSAGNNALARMVNVTAVAPGSGSTGVEASSTGDGGSVTVDGLNVIASGTGADIAATGASGGSAAFAEFSFSAFDSEFEAVNGSVSDPGSDSNLTRPPLLVNPAAGDVHQHPGSWTIDRGSRNLGDGVDIDGESRFQGAAPDIGADELTVLRQNRRCFDERATIVASGPHPISGTPGHDVIIGTAGHDVIDSGGGRDLICSLGGRDTIRAGGGPDKVKSAGAGDKLLGQAGNDLLLGGAGRDRIKGGPGNDRIFGGGGRDHCGGGSGKNRIARCE